MRFRQLLIFRANAIRRVFEFFSMTQKFFTPLSIACLSCECHFYHSWLIKFSSSRNSQTQNNAIVRNARINFGFLILIISWRLRWILDLYRGVLYVSRRFVIVILSSSRSAISQGGFDLSVRTRKKKESRTKLPARPVDIDRDVIYQCVGLGFRFDVSYARDTRRASFS